MKGTPRPIQIVVSDLNRIYDSLSTFRTSYDFYLAIADYCLKLEQSGHFGPIYKEMHEEAKKDMGMYQDAWQKLLEMAIPLVKDLIHKINDGQIPFEYKATTEKSFHPLSLQLDGLKSFVMKDQPITSIDSQQDGFYSNYASFMRYIFETEKQNTIQNHLLTGGEWVLEPYYRAYDDAKDQYQAIREQRPWWAHYQIGRITYAIHKDQYPDTYAQYYDRNDIIDSLYELGVVEAKRGGNESGLFLQRSKYERYIKLLHEFVGARISHIQAKSELSEYVHTSATIELYHLDKKASYRSVVVSLSAKELTLLALLADRKGMNVKLAEIVSESKRARDLLSDFDTEKSVRDTFRRLLTKLQVRKGEFFPITLSQSSLFWIDRSAS